MLPERTKKIIDVIQWILIIVLGIMCLSHIFVYKEYREFINNEEYQKDQTYIKIYESQELVSLKKENKELYDSLRVLKNAESGVQIKYVYKIKTDTVKVTEFIHEEKDSIYHYTHDNDTLRYEMDVKAERLEWVKGEFTINDKFTIINREENGLNQTFVHHSDNVNITDVDAWHRINDKKKWYNNFHVGLQLGAGYGIIHKTPDIYVGVGVTYTFK